MCACARCARYWMNSFVLQLKKESNFIPLNWILYRIEWKQLNTAQYTSISGSQQLHFILVLTVFDCVDRCFVLSTTVDTRCERQYSDGLTQILVFALMHFDSLISFWKSHLTSFAMQNSWILIFRSKVPRLLCYWSPRWKVFSDLSPDFFSGESPASSPQTLIWMKWTDVYFLLFDLFLNHDQTWQSLTFSMDSNGTKTYKNSLSFSGVSILRLNLLCIHLGD